MNTNRPNPNSNHVNRNRTVAAGITQPLYPYIYFVSFHATVGGGDVFGNCEVALDREITTIERVLDLEKTLQAQGRSRAKIMGFTLLRVVQPAVQRRPS
jgi:hypothetical protein